MATNPDCNLIRCCFGCSNFSVIMAGVEAQEVETAKGILHMPAHTVRIVMCAIAEDGKEDDDTRNEMAAALLTGGASCSGFTPFDFDSSEDTTDDDGNIVLPQFGESFDYTRELGEEEE